MGASIDMVQVLSMEIAKSHSRRMASKSAASIWAGLEMAKRQRQKLETKSGGISNISGLDGRPTAWYAGPLIPPLFVSSIGVHGRF